VTPPQIECRGGPGRPRSRQGARRRSWPATPAAACTQSATIKVDVRLPGKGNSNSCGARPVHLIITMIKWIRTSRLSIKNSLQKSRNKSPSRNNSTWNFEEMIQKPDMQYVDWLALAGRDSCSDLNAICARDCDSLKKSAAHREKSREWNVSKQKWNLC